MRPAIVSGIVTGDAPVSYWPIFFSVPSNSPKRLSKVYAAQFPSRFFHVIKYLPSLSRSTQK